MEQIKSGRDRHDFCTQFVQHGGVMPEKRFQAACAKAVACFGSVDDSHPTYQARYRALQQDGERITLQVARADGPTAVDLVPEANEMAKEMTMVILSEWVRLGWRPTE